MKTIVIPKKLRDYIEKLNYEKTSRLNNMIFMMQNNICNIDMFDKINNEYREYFICYELAKKKLEEMYISPQVESFLKWELDFNSNEVRIHE